MAPDDAPLRQRLARGIRARREELGLTQEGAAEQSGLSARFWRRLEAGDVGVSLDTVDQVLRGLAWNWAGLCAVLDRRNVGDRSKIGRTAARRAPPAAHGLLDAAWRSVPAREFSALVTVLGRFSR